ncbi:MAG: Hsp33 family molecular chaperone HslO [Kiritimatiellae bacterium]|nr:Hsp33 family molecular chaperone HslO [Kiritimatiellia bacterium]
MVLARTNDCCLEAFSPSKALRFLYADVSETARRLVAAHGLSAPAARVFGKALAGLGLLGVDVGEDDEVLCFDADLEGPLGGFHLERDGNGHLRGHAFEAAPETLLPSGAAPDDAALCGRAARVKITRVAEDGGAIRSQMSFAVEPATPDIVLTAFFNNAIPTRLSLCATDCDGEPDRVRALAVQRLPGADDKDFARVARLFADGTVADQLEFDATLATMRDVLDLWDLKTGPTRALAFGCSCSAKRVLASFAERPAAQLRALAAAGGPVVFRCHLCGREYKVGPAALATFARRRSARSR